MKQRLRLRPAGRSGNQASADKTTIDVEAKQKTESGRCCIHD